MTAQCDVAIIGAGAAGLAAAFFAGEASGGMHRIVLLDGAAKPGAKILVSGGGRCNITNEKVRPNDFYGGSPVLIRNVLRAFSEQDTLAWMRSLGVETKLEPTGKYFPVSDKARTVLDALTHSVEELGAKLNSGTRVTGIDRQIGGSFCLRVRPSEELHAKRLIVATGGLALPKSGSDGAGLEWMKSLGHTIVPTTPALAPLVLREGPEPGGQFARLSGLTTDVRIVVSALDGKKLFLWTGPLLFTHFGVSGPAAMNASRHIARYKLDTGEQPLVTIGHPDFSDLAAADSWLKSSAAKSPRMSVARAVAQLYPERLAELLASGLDTFSTLSREQRQQLARRLAALPLPVVGDRGYAFAEATAGGVNLHEVDIRTMESRVVPGLYLCGEILDVDGRIGGFNFQWAWSTGYLAGKAAARG